MPDSGTDILMITYNRPAYTELALARLLDTCDASMRVWVWHNGTDAATLAVVDRLRSHPRLFKFRHSQTNAMLTQPTNWLWAESDGAYLSKVDDDCLMPDGWGRTLRDAHQQNATLGAIGCWRFPDEDFLPEIAHRKIRRFPGGHRVMVNCWVEGSGYLMKRECVNAMGPLKAGQSFPQYLKSLANKGWTHGWYFPFLYQEHMDDPRATHTLLKADADLAESAPLMAQRWQVRTLDEFTQRFRDEARFLQTASPNPRDYAGGPRAKFLAAGRRVLDVLNGRARFKAAGS